MFHTPRIRFQVSMHSRSVVVTLVIRWKFWDCWKGRAWEIGNDSCGGSGYGSFSGSSGELYFSDGSLSLMGVAGILRKEQEMWESTDKSNARGFSRLECSYAHVNIPPQVGVYGSRMFNLTSELWNSLLDTALSTAQEMVMLAEKMRQKLLSGSSSQSSSGNNEKMGSKEDMQEWLLSVGIISPVTKDSAGAMYNQQPSSQILSGSP